MSRYPLHHSWFWERYPFFRVLIPLISGILLYDTLWGQTLSISILLSATIILGLTFIALSAPRRLPTSLKTCTFITGQGFFLALGLLICHKGDIRKSSNWFASNTGTTKGYIVNIIDPPQEKPQIWKLHVRVLRSIDSNESKPVSGEAFVSIYKDNTLFPYSSGDTLMMNAQWHPIKNSGNPFEFDYAKACARKGIYHQAFIAPNEIQLYGKASPITISTLDRLHTWSNRQLTDYIKDTATLSLLQAMLLGDERNIDPDTRQAYSDTGVIHIVSISGSHVAMLFLLITWLFFCVRGRYGNLIKYSIGLLVVWLYVIMAGAPPSAVRSALMFSVLALGIILSKERQPLNTLFAAAFVLLLIQPQWLFTVGFQLSFTAVLSLALFYQPLYELWPPKHRLSRWVWQGIAASLAAELLTAPLVIYYFHNLPLFVVFANLIAGLLIGVCALVGGFAILLFCWLPIVASSLARLLIVIVHFFNATMAFFQKLTFPSWKYLQISLPELLLIYLIISAMGYAWLERRRAPLKLALATSCILLCSFITRKWNALHQDRLVVYNAGKEARLEHIAGSHYSILLPGPEANDNYTTKAAHIGWNAWRKTEESSANPFIFKGQKILVLNENIPYDTSMFPVDILMIPIQVKSLSANTIQHIFHPGQIVLLGRQSRYYKATFIDSCLRLNITLHDVASDGALIIE